MQGSRAQVNSSAEASSLRASGAPGRIALYADAVRNARLRQLAYRPRRLLPNRVLAAGLRPSAATPGWHPLAAGLELEDPSPFGPSPPPHLHGVFRAGKAERAAGTDSFWSDDSSGSLFLFRLHGFPELARYAAGDSSPEGDAFWTEVLTDWLDRCGSPSKPGWHPYPLSGRVLAWCVALSREGWPDGLRDRMLTSLWLQVRYLRRSIEHDIGGNHVLRNAVALTVGGACLEHARTREGGLSLLARELKRQVGADGGHEERSTSYQRQIVLDLENTAIVLGRAGHQSPVWLEQTLKRMRGWVDALAGPGGELPILNDGWDGPPVAARTRHAKVTDLAESGYLVLRDRSAQAVLDVGELAPRHLPPHAHADALSFVLWAGGSPVVIDPGSGAYSGPERDQFRATRAHNTVEVDGRDQCEFWGPFRAAFLPKVERSPLTELEGALIVTARHDGYARLPNPVSHERTFIWLGADGLVVLDRLVAREEHVVISRLHFAEGIREPLGGDLPGGFRVSAVGSELGDPTERSSARAPFLGTQAPISVAELSGTARPGAYFGWALTPDDVVVVLRPGRVELSRPGHSTQHLGLADLAAVGR
jgi:uncharacterized heparinase superfamily protein